MTNPEISGEVWPLNTAQDFSNDRFHYGVVREGQLYMVTSDRQCIPMWVAEARGTRFTSKELSMSRFSMRGINQFLEEEIILNPVDIFHQILNHIKTYIYLPHESCYTAIALWVMGTYVFRIFRYFPYIHLYAEKASGKTTLMEILEKICFNGEISSDATGVSLFHQVDANSSTLFLDESEDLYQGRNNAKMRLLKAGFSKTGRVKRKKATYCCYSPKMIAGISPLDNVLGDRTITVRMLRKLPTEAFRRYYESPEILELYSRIRDSLYMFGLTHAQKLMAEYVRVSESPEKTLLKNRALDLWLPLIVIGSIVDETVAADVMQFAQVQSRQREENEALDNETSRLLEVLHSATNDIKPIRIDGNTIYIEPDIMFAYFSAVEAVPKGASRTWLSRTLHQKFDILCPPVRRQDGLKRAFEIDTTKLDEMIRRYA